MIKGNRFCLIMKRHSKSLARVIAEAGTGEGASIGVCG
jgi:hypothetical protein